MAFNPPYGGVPPYNPGVPPFQYNPLLTTMYMNQGAMPVQPMNVSKKNSIVTKFFFVQEGDNRRLKIRKNTKFKGLMVHIERYLSPYSEKYGSRIKSLQYEDDEGDWMNFNTENEWLECIKLTLLKKKSGKIRIRIFTASKAKKEEPEEQEEEGEDEIDEVEDDQQKQQQQEEEPNKEKEPPFVVPPEYTSKV